MSVDVRAMQQKVANTEAAYVRACIKRDEVLGDFKELNQAKADANKENN
jgi:hypothetical protein